ncbi:MAG: LPS export ABC transporter ATP-binding protein [Phycisphaeraceae bacterium]
MDLLKAEKLRKSYGGRVVVDDVSFLVREGEIVGLLGRNGAGKTTSFRIAMGMIDAEGGQVTFNGQDVTKKPMYQRARLGMGYLAQEPSIFRRMTVDQNLMAILETRKNLSRSQRKDRAGELLTKFGLHKVHSQMATSLSGGERRKLEIARALITEPLIMLLDEPFTGVDPIAIEDLQREVSHLRDNHGIATLITDHNERRILQMCDRVYVIFEGKVFAEGTPKEIVSNELVRKRYLGESLNVEEFKR